MEAYRIKHKLTRLYYNKYVIVEVKIRIVTYLEKERYIITKKTISFLQGRLCKSNNEKIIGLS